MGQPEKKINHWQLKKQKKNTIDNYVNAWNFSSFN